VLRLPFRELGEMYLEWKGVYVSYMSLRPISVAASSKTWVCGRSLAGIAGSNPAGVMDVCLCDYCVLLGRGIYEEADHPSRGVLPSVVCLRVIVKFLQRGGL